MTLEKIRAALPTHIMLTPGVHKWREGDQFTTSGENGGVMVWTLGGGNKDIGKFVNQEFARRPIPPHILDNQAFWIWYENFCDSTLIDYAVGQVEAQRKAGRLYDKWLLEQMEDV